MKILYYLGWVPVVAFTFLAALLLGLHITADALADTAFNLLVKPCVKGTE